MLLKYHKKSGVSARIIFLENNARCIKKYKVFNSYIN